MFRGMTAAVVLALCVSSSAAYAADSSKEKLGAAKELLELTFSKESWNVMTEAMFAALPPEAKDLVHPDDLMTYQEIADLQTSLFVKYYSTDELRQLVKFYKSPVGAKALRIMPEVMQDVQGLVMMKMQKLPEVLQRRMAEKKATGGSGAPAPSAGDPQKAPGQGK